MPFDRRFFHYKGDDLLPIRGAACRRRALGDRRVPEQTSSISRGRCFEAEMIMSSSGP